MWQKKVGGNCDRRTLKSSEKGQNGYAKKG